MTAIFQYTPELLEEIHMAGLSRARLLGEQVGKIQVKISEILDLPYPKKEDVERLQLYCQSLQHLAASIDEVRNTL